MPDIYNEFLQEIKEIGCLASISGLLEWDQETQMPKRGVEARSEQFSIMAGLAHERMISDKMRDLLNRVEAPAGDPIAETNIRETRRQFERKTKLPTPLVKEIAETGTLAKAAWVEAREKNDFSIFAPLLQKTMEQQRKVAELIGYETEPYDALMDEYEPAAKSAEIEVLFRELVGATVPILQKIEASDSKPDASILTRKYPQAQQEIIAHRVAEAIRFDFDAGRDDISVHPFCMTVGGPGDVRITTRYMEEFLPAAMFGTMHEAGHGLYEQGLPIEHRFTPAGEAISLGIHESQSRLWENMVGRSRAFWEYHYAGLQELFPESLGDVSLDGFYGAINSVQPSMIRVEADEVTYNLHIALRFEIERALISGDIEVSDVPAVWNEKFEKYLGITPPTDADGCLQDIHWSLGAVGYFATYALGNLYAAQFYAQAEQDIPDLPDQIKRNNHRPLLDWLRENIHRHGMRYRAHELVEKVTGKPLSIVPFVDYVQTKYGEVYGF